MGSLRSDVYRDESQIARYQARADPPRATRVCAMFSVIFLLFLVLFIAIRFMRRRMYFWLPLAIKRKRSPRGGKKILRTRRARVLLTAQATPV